MQNQPYSGGNPSLPVDAELAKETKDDTPKDELDKSEKEKDQESGPGDEESFDLDKVDDLQDSKKGEKED